MLFSHCFSGSDVTCQKKLLMLYSSVAATGVTFLIMYFSLQQNLDKPQAPLWQNYLSFLPFWEIHVAKEGLRLILPFRLVSKQWERFANIQWEEVQIKFGTAHSSFSGIRLDTTIQLQYLSCLVIPQRSRGWDSTSELGAAFSQISDTWISSNYQQWPTDGASPSLKLGNGSNSMSRVLGQTGGDSLQQLLSGAF